MGKPYKINYLGREIIIIDYSDLKEDDMIALSDSAVDLVLKEKKFTLVLNIFNERNYVTPKFMRNVEKSLPSVEHLQERNAIIGLSQVQLWILKAVNLWHKKQIHYFETKEAALEFLVQDH